MKKRPRSLSTRSAIARRTDVESRHQSPTCAKRVLPGASVPRHILARKDPRPVNHVVARDIDDAVAADYRPAQRRLVQKLRNHLISRYIQLRREPRRAFLQLGLHIR